MPSIVRVNVHATRNVPIMDRMSKLADANVELAFSKQAPARTTSISPSTPVFDLKFKLEVPDDTNLVTEPLVFTAMDRGAAPLRVGSPQF